MKNKNQLANEISEKYLNRQNRSYNVDLNTSSFLLETSNLKNSLSVSQLKMFNQIEKLYLDYFSNLVFDVIEFTVNEIFHD